MEYGTFIRRKINRGLRVFILLFCAVWIISASEEYIQKSIAAMEEISEQKINEAKEDKSAAEQSIDDKHIDDMKPKIALTFDDGPHPVYTPILLDGLKERGIKATFFVIGTNIDGREDIIKRIYDEGHILGNHTYNHVSIKNLNDEQACAELVSTNELIKEITGEDTQYIRPPFGEMKDGLDCGIPMLLVKWTVDSKDWTTKNVSQIVNKVVTDVKENDIILLHDWYESSVEAALKIVDILLDEGYEFVTVDDIIFD